MSKRSVFTTITALPSQVTRQTALDCLHSHTEMIDLNPLVIERHPIKPPGKATPEEFHCIWYSITDRVSYVPGQLITGKVTYSACFHDLADGLQTHVYAPAGLDIKEKWSIGGNAPGEPPLPVEMGQGIPLSGLYLREDIDMSCNVFLTSFVKKTLKKAHAKLIARLVVKAQLEEREKERDRLEGRASVRSEGTMRSMSTATTATPRMGTGGSSVASSSRFSPPLHAVHRFSESAVPSRSHHRPITANGAAAQENMDENYYSSHRASLNDAIAYSHSTNQYPHNVFGISTPPYANPTSQQQQYYSPYPEKHDEYAETDFKPYTTGPHEIAQDNLTPVRMQLSNGVYVPKIPRTTGPGHGRHPSEGSAFAVELEATEVQKVDTQGPPVPVKEPVSVGE